MTKISDKITATSGFVELQATRTNWVDNSVLNVTMSGTGVGTFNPTDVSGFAWTDSQGNYRFSGNIAGTVSTSSTPFIDVAIAGLDFTIGAVGKAAGYGSYNSNVPFDTIDANAGSGVRARFNSAQTSGATIIEVVLTDAVLGGQPSWFDDNLMTSSGLPVATANSYGVVKDESRFCKIYSTTSQNGNPDSSTVVKIYDSIASDTHSMADLGNNRIIPNLPGLYYCEGFALSYGPGNNTVISNTVSMRKNGTGVYIASDFYNDGTSNLGGAFNFRRRVSGVLEFNGSTDYIDLTSNMDTTGGTWDLDGGGVGSGYLFVVRISSLPSLT